VRLRTTLGGTVYDFGSIREVLAKSSPPRSGDMLAGVAARDGLERVAARAVLAERTLAELREHPVLPYESDEVTRVVEDALDEAAFRRVASLTVGDFRDWLLSDAAGEAELGAIARGLTPEMAAAVGKLMSNLDLIVAARKIRVVRTCNTTVGLAGRFSSRV